MPCNLPVRLCNLLGTWTSPQVLSKMLSVVACGRVVARTLFNSAEVAYYPSLSLATSPRCSYSSQVHSSQPYKLVTAISGFSKLDSPSRRSSRIPPTAVPAIDKRLFGDDACFVASHNTSDVLGVADGVGGWRNYGIDPSQFSKKLMATCEMLVKTGKFVPNQPSALLASGYLELKEDKEPLAGSSTACIVVLNRAKMVLHTANLGDSGFMVVRRGSVVHRSVEQQHSFNAPFQLSIAPEEHSGDILHDRAEDADTSAYNLELGDIIITATDGLFDNLPDSAILEELARLKDSEYKSLKSVAWNIVEQALLKAFDPDYMSPFAKQARKSGHAAAKGGKPDDITVLVSIVTVEGD